MQQLQDRVNRLEALLTHCVPLTPGIKTGSNTTSDFKGEAAPIDVSKVRITPDPDLLGTLIGGFKVYIQDHPEAIRALWLDHSEEKLLVAKIIPAPIKSEDETADQFGAQIKEPVLYLAKALSIHTPTLETPDRIPGVSVQPDRVFKANGTGALVVEYKNPTCGSVHLQVLIDEAAEPGGLNLDFRKPNTESTSILSKLTLYCGRANILYGMVVDMQNFLIIRRDRTQGQTYHFSISDLVPIESKDTPIISIILWIMLLAWGALEDDEHEDVDDDDDGEPEEADDDDDDELEEADPDVDDELEEESDHEATSPSSGPAPPSATTYWTPSSVNETALAAVLEERGSMSVRWRVPRYREVIWLTARWPNTRVWNTALPSTDLSASIRQTDLLTPAPSPPSVPFEIHLDREIMNNVFDAHMPDVPVPLIVKYAPTDQAKRELAAWKTLRHMAGTRIPGLFGVYSIDVRTADPHAFIIQQYGGTSPKSYGTLNMNQRKELYDIVCEMHRFGIYHGDLAPRNVAVNDEGNLMVLDFGVSNSHNCPGESRCGELMGLKSELGPERVQTSETLFQFRHRR